MTEKNVTGPKKCTETDKWKGILMYLFNKNVLMNTKFCSLIRLHVSLTNSQTPDVVLQVGRSQKTRLSTIFLSPACQQILAICFGPGKMKINSLNFLVKQFTDWHESKKEFWVLSKTPSCELRCHQLWLIWCCRQKSWMEFAPSVRLKTRTLKLNSTTCAARFDRNKHPWSNCIWTKHTKILWHVPEREANSALWCWTDFKIQHQTQGRARR